MNSLYDRGGGPPPSCRLVPASPPPRSRSSVFSVMSALSSGRGSPAQLRFFRPRDWRAAGFSL